MSKYLVALVGFLIIVAVYGSMCAEKEEKPLEMAAWVDGSNQDVIVVLVETNELANILVCFRDELAGKHKIQGSTGSCASEYDVDYGRFDLGFKSSYLSGTGKITVTAITSDGRRNLTTLVLKRR